MKQIPKGARIALAAMSALAVVTVAVSTTMGMLTSVTEAKENKFSHGIVNIEVEEQFDDEANLAEEPVEKQVRIENSDADGALPNIVPVYIRVQLVAQWMDEEENLMAVEADKLVDYTLNLKDEQNAGSDLVAQHDVTGQWILADDGYYYFTGVVEPKCFTDYLLLSVTAKAGSVLPTEGHLEVEVLADAVQYTGGAVEDAWGTPTADGKNIAFLSRE